MQVGRPPVPTWLRAMRGTLAPGERADEPQPREVAEVPAPSDWADERPTAAAFWETHLPLLARNKMLTEVDMTAFSMLCICFEELVIAEKELKEKGKVITTENGYLVQSPYVSIAAQRRKEFADLMREFGLTPAARSRIRMQIPQPGAEYDGGGDRQAVLDLEL